MTTDHTPGHKANLANFKAWGLSPDLSTREKSVLAADGKAWKLPYLQIKEEDLIMETRTR